MLCVCVFMFIYLTGHILYVCLICTHTTHTHRRDTHRRDTHTHKHTYTHTHSPKYSRILYGANNANLARVLLVLFMILDTDYSTLDTDKFILNWWKQFGKSIPTNVVNAVLAKLDTDQLALVRKCLAKGSTSSMTD